MRRRLGVLAVLALAAILGTTSSSYAQGSFAQLNGTVTDESGGAVAKASVTMRDLDTNLTYTTASGDAGFYVFPKLGPGRYELKVSFAGFSNYTQTGFVLTVGQSATLNITLKIASKGEQIVVNSEAPVIEPTRTEVSQVIDTKQIDSLPISGRLFTDFALLTPGVATGRTSLQSTITEFEVTRVSFAGMRDLSNEVTVDGADNINTATGSQRSTPPQEAVSEFRVVNNGFGAEYGRALGGIVNIVTKSGTNDFHGSVYDYLQNNATDARSLLQPAPQGDALRQNQYGATAGGPIKKDKTFFFANYEGQRRGESPTYPTTLLQPVGLLNGDMTTNLALIDSAKQALGIAPEDVNILKTKDNDYGIVKVDHQFNADNHLSIRYSVEDARDLNQLVGSTLDGGGIGAPSSGHNVFLRDQSLVGDLATTLRPNLVNSFLAQWARRHYNFPGTTGQPNLDIPNTLLFGHNFGVLDAIYESRAQFSDSLAWVKGNHVAKFGVDLNYVNNFVIWPGFTPMRIVLPGINCLVDFANYVTFLQDPATPTSGYIASAPADGPCPTAASPYFPAAPGPNTALDPLNGVPIVFWGAPVGSGVVPPGFEPPAIPTNWANAYLPSQTVNFSETLDHAYYGFYAQDQWRLSKKFTVNYGLRYDFETGLSKQIDPDYRGFQPRIGVAYSPDNKTVIRAGFGLFDDRYNLSFLFITQPQRPNSLCGPEASSATTGPCPGFITQTLPGIRKDADTATWVLNQLTPGPPNPGGTQIFPADAAATLVTTGVVPPQYLSGPPNSLVTAGSGMVDHASRIPYSEQANIEIDREIGHGLAVSAGYLFVAAHKLVRAENLNVCPPDGSTGLTVPAVTPGTPGCTPPPASAIPPDWPAGKAYFYNTPAGPAAGGGSPAFENAGLLYFTDNSGNSVYHGLTLQVSERIKNFTLNANYTYSHTLDDGTFTTFVSTPQDLYNRALERANSNQDVRHRFITNFTAEGPKETIVRKFAFSSIITLQTGRPFTEFVGFDANGDTNPVTDRVGIEPRNSYFGDPLYSWDLRLSRYFQIREKLRLDLMVDAFNVLNRPNVDEVTSVYGAAVFCGNGAIPMRYKDSATYAAQAAAAAFDAGTGPPTCPLSGLGLTPAPPVPNGLFGTARTMLNPRQFQFAAKFSF
jgi:hypothetical protein